MNYNPNIHHRKSIRLKGYDYSQAGLYFITICCQDRAHLFGEIRRGEPACSPDTCSPQMILNDAGQMIGKWYHELENKFPDIRCHEMIVMPNHFHCIVENTTVGADLRVCPNRLPTTQTITAGNASGQPTPVLGEPTGEPTPVLGEPLGEPTPVLGEPLGEPTPILGEPSGEPTPVLGEPLGEPTPVSGQPLGEPMPVLGQPTPVLGEPLGEHIGSPLHRVVQWFKTMSTNEYIRGVKQNNWQPFNGKLWQRNYYEHIIRTENDYHRIAQYIINNPKNWDNDKLR